MTGILPLSHLYRLSVSPRVESRSDLGRTERLAAGRQNDPRPRDALVRRTSAAHASDGHINDQALGMPEQRLLDLCRGHLHSRNFQRVLSPIARSDRVWDTTIFYFFPPWLDLQR